MKICERGVDIREKAGIARRRKISSKSNGFAPLRLAKPSSEGVLRTFGICARLSVRHSCEKIHHDKRGQFTGLSVDIELWVDLDDVDRFYFLTQAGEMGCFQ